MKNAIIAVGAALVAAVGCASLDGATSTGSTEQAVLTGPLTAGNDPADLGATQKAQFSMDCSFLDGSTSYHVKAGGFDAANGSTATSRIVMLKRDPSSPPSWVTQTATLSVARGQGQSFKLDNTHCAIIAGATKIDGTGTASGAVDLLTLDTSVTPRVVLRTTLGSLNTARSDFRVSSCTDSDGAVHMIAVDGRNANTFLNSVESSRKVADVIANAGSLWRTTTVNASTARANFGLDKNGNNEYVASGGQIAGATANAIANNTLFAMTTVTVSSIKYCDIPDANHIVATPAHNATLSSPTKGNIVHYDAASGKFLVAFGIDDSGMAPVLYGGEKLTVNFTAPYDITTKVADAPSAGAYRPVQVRIDANKGMFLTGSNAAVTTSLTAVHQYGSGTWDTAVNTSTGIYGGSAALLTDGGATYTEVWIDSGDSTPGTTLGTLVAAFTP